MGPAPRRYEKTNVIMMMGGYDKLGRTIYNRLPALIKTH